MRIPDARPNVAAQAPQADKCALSADQVGSLFSGVDLGWLPSSDDVRALLGRAANALAALFGNDDGAAGSIVDFGDAKSPAHKGGGAHKSIVDFGDRPSSIVDFGDRPSSIVDFGDGAVDDAAD